MLISQRITILNTIWRIISVLKLLWLRNDIWLPISVVADALSIQIVGNFHKAEYFNTLYQSSTSPCNSHINSLIYWFFISYALFSPSLSLLLMLLLLQLYSKRHMSHGCFDINLCRRHIYTLYWPTTTASYTQCKR